MPVVPKKQESYLSTVDLLARWQRWLGVCGSDARLIPNNVVVASTGISVGPSTSVWIATSDDAITLTGGSNGGVLPQARIPLSWLSTIQIGGRGSYTGRPTTGKDMLLYGVVGGPISATRARMQETIVVLQGATVSITLANRGVPQTTLVPWLTPLYSRVASQTATEDPPTPEHAPRSPGERIRELAKLRDDGLLTEPEFEEKRAALVAEM